MSSTAYRIPEAPEFSKSTVQAWWTMNPETQLALGYCPNHKRNVQPAREDFEFGRQPSCSLCGEWLTTLEVVSL
jgi:hypothetical protein